MNYTITKRHITPVSLICVVLLSVCTIILLILLTSFKQPENAPHAEIARQDDEYYNTRRPSWKDMKDFQVQIVGKYAIFSTYGENVFIVPLHKKCNLSRAIREYNQSQDNE